MGKLNIAGETLGHGIQLYYLAVKYAGDSAYAKDESNKEVNLI